MHFEENYENGIMEEVEEVFVLSFIVVKFNTKLTGTYAKDYNFVHLA